MVLMTLAVLATTLIFSAAAGAATAGPFRACLEREDQEIPHPADDDPAQGQELVAAGSRANNVHGHAEAPFIVIRLSSGQQFYIDSLQSAFRLYTTASERFSPAQLRAFLSAAEQLLRCQGGVVSVRGSHRNINNNGGIGARVVGGSILGSLGNAAPADIMATPLRTFSMVPLRLRSVVPANATGGGGSRISVCQGGQAPAIRSSANDMIVVNPYERSLHQQEHRQLSGVRVFLDMHLIASLPNSRAMWRHPCLVPCQLVALDIAATSTVVRPTAFSLDSAPGGGGRRSRGRTTARQRYTVCRGHRRWPLPRSPSPVRSGGAAARRSIPPAREESSATSEAQGEGICDRRTSKVAAVGSKGVSTTSAASPGPTPIRNVSSSPAITGGGRGGFKAFGSCHDGAEGSNQDVLDYCMQLQDQGETLFGIDEYLNEARARARSHPYPFDSTLGARSKAAETASFVHRRPQDESGLPEGDAISTTAASPRPADPMSFEQGGASPATSQACVSFKPGDRVIYRDQRGVAEGGVILAVYPSDGRCKFQGDIIFNETHTVAACDLSPHQADRACSSFEAGDKVVYRDQHGVEKPGVVLFVYSNGSRYEFLPDGLTKTVALSDLTLDEVALVYSSFENDGRVIYTDQDGSGEAYLMVNLVNEHRSKSDTSDSVGTVDASDLVRDEAGSVNATADGKATNTAEDIATETALAQKSTPPLTPTTPCSTPTTTCGAPDVQEFFGNCYDDNDDNDGDNDDHDDHDDGGDDETDSGRGNAVVGDPLLVDGDDDATVVETSVEVVTVPCVADFGFISPPDEEEEEEEEDDDDDDDDDAPAAGYLAATGLNMELLNSAGGNMDGGFGDVLFVTDKNGGQEYAFKKAKDTAGGRRQMEREVQVLGEVHGKVSNIVQVEEFQCNPLPMLLMRKEPGTLTSMLKDASNSVPRDIVKVLCGVLTAIGELHDKFRYLHRDLKPDNILVDEHGDGKLVDFGMCVKALDASRPEFIGDGTPAYCAPETSTPRGASVASEIYAVGVILLEGLMNNCPFGSEELVKAATDRLDDLEANREDLMDQIEFEREMEDEEPEEEEDGEEAEEGKDDYDKGEKSTQEKLELVRINEHRLGVVNDDGWEPNDAALVVLAELGPPLRFFMVQSEDDSRSKEERGDEARREAQADPRRLFEDNWVEWLTTLSRAECDEGLRAAVELVLVRGMLDPDPASRPQTTEAAQEVLLEALAVYEAAERAEWE